MLVQTFYWLQGGSLTLFCWETTFSAQSVAHFPPNISFSLSLITTLSHYWYLFVFLLQALGKYLYWKKGFPLIPTFLPPLPPLMMFTRVLRRASTHLSVSPFLSFPSFSCTYTQKHRHTESPKDCVRRKILSVFYFCLYYLTVSQSFANHNKKEKGG